MLDGKVLGGMSRTIATLIVFPCAQDRGNRVFLVAEKQFVQSRRGPDLVFQKNLPEPAEGLLTNSVRKAGSAD